MMPPARRRDQFRTFENTDDIISNKEHLILRKKDGNDGEKIGLTTAGLLRKSELFHENLPKRSPGTAITPKIHLNEPPHANLFLDIFKLIREVKGE
jgi:hypothetical protein